MSLHPYATDFARQLLAHRIYGASAGESNFFLCESPGSAERELGSSFGISVMTSAEFLSANHSARSIDSLFVHGIFGSRNSEAWASKELGNAAPIRFLADYVAVGGSLSFTIPDPMCIRHAFHPKRLARLLAKQALPTVARIENQLRNAGFDRIIVWSIQPDLNSPMRVVPRSAAQVNEMSFGTAGSIKELTSQNLRRLGFSTTPDLLVCAKRV
jgi:hypothetical protein